MHNTPAATKNANVPLSPTRTKRQIDSRTF